MSARLNKEEPQQRDTHALLQSALETLLDVLEKRMHEIADEAVHAQEDLRSFTIQNVMERLGITRSAVTKMIAEGKLEAVRTTERRIRITARSLRLFLYGEKERNK